VDMGIVTRVEALLASGRLSHSQGEALVGSLYRLAGKERPEDMGQRFKVMAITSPEVNREMVPGFGFLTSAGMGGDRMASS